jgi:hypothetical protein
MAQIFPIQKIKIIVFIYHLVTDNAQIKPALRDVAGRLYGTGFLDVNIDFLVRIQCFNKAGKPFGYVTGAGHG